MAALSVAQIRRHAGVRSEVTLVAIGLGLLAALVYGDHIARGGFIWDDWENAGTTRYHYESGFLGPIDLRQAAYRPVLQLLIPLPHLLFGDAPAPHLALGLACAVAACATFYALLRALGAARPFAVGAAALALVFPWSSSTRLWATASLNMLAVALVCGAGAVSLRALSRGADARRERALLTAAMCAAAVLTYEAVAGIIALLPLLYRQRVPWRAALARWRPEAIAGGAAAVLVAFATTKRESGGGTALEHGVLIARQGLALAGRALGPLDALPPAVGIGVAVALVAAALALGRAAGRRAALAAGLSLAALILAWAPFVPGEPKYVPAAPGIYDRVNIVAGFALAALVCSLAECVRVVAPRRIAVPLAVGAAAVIGAGWLVHARAEVATYDRAAAYSRDDLDAIGRAVPKPPTDAVVVLFHDRSYAAPGVPTFGQPWDLSPALKLRYGDATLTGFPVAPDARVDCGATALAVHPRGVDTPPPAPYARALLVNGDTGHAVRVHDARECRAAAARMAPRRPGV